MTRETIKKHYRTALKQMPFVGVALVICMTLFADFFVLKTPKLALAKIPLLIMATLALIRPASFWMPAAIGAGFVLLDFIRGNFQLTFISFALWIVAWLFLLEELISRISAGRKR